MSIEKNLRLTLVKKNDHFSIKIEEEIYTKNIRRQPKFSKEVNNKNPTEILYNKEFCIFFSIHILIYLFSSYECRSEKEYRNGRHIIYIKQDVCKIFIKLDSEIQESLPKTKYLSTYLLENNNCKDAIDNETNCIEFVKVICEYLFEKPFKYCVDDVGESIIPYGGYNIDLDKNQNGYE